MAVWGSGVALAEPEVLMGVADLRSVGLPLASAMIPFSVLDLVPIIAGGNAGQAFRNSLDLAQHAEKRGFFRYWVAEHHNMPGIASAATSVVIAHLAGGTSTIRVGSGGIMLPNHAPLAIAEQFGTLESLFPGRIDLGLGRAPGGDQITARALRRVSGGSGDSFPQDVMELQGYFRPVLKDQLVQAVPGGGLEVPLYLLGSSDFGARLAAEMGLPFAFASHFAPDYLETALALYRRDFKASAANEKLHAIVAVNVFAADTDEEARLLFTSLQQQFLNLIRGHPGQLQSPVADMRLRWSLAEEEHVRRMTRYSLVGSADTIRRQVIDLIQQTDANEIIATALIFDHPARLRSFEIFADVMKSLG